MRLLLLRLLAMMLQPTNRHNFYSWFICRLERHPIFKSYGCLHSVCSFQSTSHVIIIPLNELNENHMKYIKALLTENWYMRDRSGECTGLEKGPLYSSTSLLMESQTAQYFHSPRKGTKRATTSIPSTALQLDYFYCIWKPSVFSIRYLNVQVKSKVKQKQMQSSFCLSEAAVVPYRVGSSQINFKSLFSTSSLKAFTRTMSGHPDGPH